MYHISLSRGSSISLGDKLTIVAIVIAVVAIVVGVWAVRRWGIRRHRILLTCTSNRLIQTSFPSKE